MFRPKCIMGAKVTKGPGFYLIPDPPHKKYNNPEWMAKVPDDTLVSALSLPGTHSSPASHTQLACGAEACCQSLSIATQMTLGIRYLDIRVRHYGNSLPLHHDCYYLDQGHLDAVLYQAQAFLKDHPTEVFFISVMQVYKDKANTQPFDETLRRYINKIEHAHLYKPTKMEHMPRINEVRGKIVLILQDSTSTLPFWKWSQLKLHLDLDPESDETKWLACKDNLDLAGEVAGKKKRHFYVTYTNYCTVHVPGQVKRPFYKPQRIRRLPKDTTAELNPRLLSYVLGTRGRLGAVVADFPSPKLIQEIIKHNMCFTCICPRCNLKERK